MTRYLLMVVLLAISACAPLHPLTTLRERKPQANDFASSLASEYLDYAEAEAEQARKASADHFAAKGLRALEGDAVLPEEAAGAKLTEARAQLDAALTADAKKIGAQIAARAQMVYDCWANGETHAYPAEEIVTCADEFPIALAKLKKAGGTDTKNDRAPNLPAHFEVFFDTDSAVVGEEGQSQITFLIALVEKVPDYRIILTATPDPHVPKDYGIKLANDRLAAVKSVMIQNGIQRNRIMLEPVTSAPTAADQNQEYITDPAGYSRRVNIEVTQQN